MRMNKWLGALATCVALLAAGSSKAEINGAVYVPANAYNVDQQWLEYNATEVARDFGYAQSVNLNSLRIFGSYYAYQQNPSRYLSNINDLLAAASQRGIRVLFVIYETVAGVDADDPVLRSSKDPLRAVAMREPVTAITRDPASWQPYRDHVRWFMDHFKNDSRLLGIEVLNEPAAADIPFAHAMVQTAVANRGSIPLSVGTLPEQVLEYVADGVDVIQFHNNFPASLAASKTLIDTRLAQAQSVNKPLWMTEWQRTRPGGANWSGNANVPAAERYTDLASMASQVKEYRAQVGAFFWSLMVKPAYLAGQRNGGTINGLFWPDGAVWDLAGARVIADNPGLVLPERKRIPFEVLRFENKGQTRWLQTTEFADGTGTGRNVQAVPTNWTGNKTKWRLVRLDGSPYFRLENVQYGLWLQCTTVPDATAGSPNPSVDSDTLAVRAVPTTETSDQTLWRWIQPAAGDHYFFLQNKATGYYLQVTPLVDVDSNGFDGGLQVRAVPSSKTGDWTRFRSIDASSP
jgi:hypothetical protein